MAGSPIPSSRWTSSIGLPGSYGWSAATAGKTKSSAFIKALLAAAVTTAGGLPSGYDPSTFKKRAFRSSAASARLSPASSRWPCRSTKNRYSHGRERCGRDSIFEMLIRLRAKTLSAWLSAPTWSRTANSAVVLSAPRAAGRSAPDHQEPRGVLRRVLDVVARSRAIRRARPPPPRRSPPRRARPPRARPPPCWKRPPRACNADSWPRDSCGTARATADGNR